MGVLIIKNTTRFCNNEMNVRLWWEVMDSEQLAPFWPTNPGDGHTIGLLIIIIIIHSSSSFSSPSSSSSSSLLSLGARNRRDYYVNVIKAPYPEKRSASILHYCVSSNYIWIRKLVPFSFEMVVQGCTREVIII